MHDAAKAVIVLNNDVGGIKTFEKWAISVVFMVRFVVGNDAHDNAAFMGCDQRVADRNTVKIVESGIDGNAGIIDAIEQRLFQLANKLAGAFACHVVGKKDDWIERSTTCTVKE